MNSVLDPPQKIKEALSCQWAKKKKRKNNNHWQWQW
jgi:hypothetical protein